MPHINIPAHQQLLHGRYQAGKRSSWAAAGRNDRPHQRPVDVSSGIRRQPLQALRLFRGLRFSRWMFSISAITQRRFIGDILDQGRHIRQPGHLAPHANAAHRPRSRSNHRRSSQRLAAPGSAASSPVRESKRPVPPAGRCHLRTRLILPASWCRLARALLLARLRFIARQQRIRVLQWC